MSYSILPKVVAIVFQLLTIYTFCGEFLALRHIKPIVKINGEVSGSSRLHVNFDGDVQSVNVICGDDDNVMVRHQRSRTIDLQHSSVHMTKEDFIQGNYTCGQYEISVSIFSKLSSFICIFKCFYRILSRLPIYLMVMTSCLHMFV